MPSQARQPSHARWRGIAFACLAALVVWPASCGPKKPALQSRSGASEERVPDYRADLAMARVELAKHAIAAHAPEEALPLLVAALEADPSCAEALATATKVLHGTRWFVPEVSIHPGSVSVDHIELDQASSLWVAISLHTTRDDQSPIHTVARWNLETLQIENVLFPVGGHEAGCMLFDPGHRYVVINRPHVKPPGGSVENIVLLCDARTLKPIRSLGQMPESLTPSAVVAFSADGLLLAHPTFASDSDRAIVWHLRDCKTGEIIRTSSPGPADAAAPLTAFLDRGKLRVMHSDGVLMEMPMSPVEPETRRTVQRPIHLLQAQFSGDGTSIDALDELGPNRAPLFVTLDIDEKRSGDIPFPPLLERFPWTMKPNLWNGLRREVKWNPISVDGTRVTFPGHDLPFPSYDVNSSITAVALRGDRVAIGDINGTINIYQALPLAAVREGVDPQVPGKPAQPDIPALSQLSEALTGNRYDATRRTMVRSDAGRRFKALEDCDIGAVSRIFPTTDFGGIRRQMSGIRFRQAAVESMVPLWNRLASADTGGKSWPELLDLSNALGATKWHRELAETVAARASGKPMNPESSPWLAASAVERVFETAGEEAILETILKTGGKGPAAAKALELALASEHPEWIAASLEKAQDLPPFLRQLALSRIAWLEGRKADALGVWPDEFPDLEKTRLYQDWDGWEQADFRKAYQDLHGCMSGLLAGLDLPADAGVEQRKEVAERLENPETLKAVGRARFARACMKAAFAFSKFKEEKETTFRLAEIARNLGEAPEPCLRAEAMALTALGEYQPAHERWVRLITEHPVATHEPGDYAEAAYTAFENSNPQQAMAILTTGLHRFPGDANFALRAGWVALLTGNADRAYRFLLSGRQIGFPPEKLENATALLAIAAMQSGAGEDAAAFYQDLIDIDADWRDPATIETLEWPEELKETLRQLSMGEPPL